MNELDLFAASIGLADPGERAALLERECAGRPDVRQRIDQLLDAHFRSQPLLDQPAPEVTQACVPNEQPGPILAGKYTLIEVIGEGGMGSVWRAKQSEPVKRFVAIKLIKAGMDSKQVLARFEAERQALAVMDHPNIAKVLDGGLHDGRPFFVMDLVKGVPITDYCDAKKLTPKERLELFVSVCQAIQHAHQKGIIHRDIKPSNVLVAMYDDKPVVKVIDFGVAKATGQALTERTIDTGFGGVVGTPQYMSPEQAMFNNLDIDTRSDVYALGVLLYELLTGSPPFSQKELEKRGLLEMLRVVREEEPPRPSTRLSTAAALPTLSANRGTEPKKLTGLLRKDLDWIVMKALEKDRARRYATASGFADDLMRYLVGEAVQAHPPSTAYQLNKLVRRNKGQVIAAGLAMFALLAGMAGTTFGLVRAEQQRLVAERAADAEHRARQEAETKRAEAEAQQRRAETGEKLAQEQKNRAEAGEKLASDRLKSIEIQRTDTERSDRIRIGRKMLFNGHVDESIDWFRAAIKLDPDDILSQQWFGIALINKGQVEDAIAHYRWLIEVNPKAGIAYAILGQTLDRMGRYDEAVAIWHNGMNADPSCTQIFDAYGAALLKRQQWVEAEQLFRNGPWRPNHTYYELSYRQSMLGEALLGQKKYAEAEPLLLEGYEEMKKQKEQRWPILWDVTLIPDALDRLIALYTATNKPDELKKWRAERAQYPGIKPAGTQ
jgi:serine/threonine protein kinase/Tfp pilus assembly protein PilF